MLGRRGQETANIAANRHSLQAAGNTLPPPPHFVPYVTDPSTELNSCTRGGKKPTRCAVAVHGRLGADASSDEHGET